MSSGVGSSGAGGGPPPTGGSVSAVGLATVGKDNMLIIKMDEPISAGTECACNRKHKDCDIFFI